ncbi:MAG: ROK family protein [Cyanobacteria bacterium SZAS LIN-3]|nr:ROK family protein [Cyanobacteria bacterium SZAS LIN-3]
MDALKITMPALGIDLGGTKIRAAAVLDNKILGEPRQIPTPNGPENIVRAILDLIISFQGQYILKGIGIATAGIINTETGEVIGATGNLPGWSGTPLKLVIEKSTLIPVHVENDANAAAFGEACARNLRDKQCVCVITLGTGIGGGLLIDGKLFRGAHWGAGEVGHSRISLGNKRLCTCGLFDCWEAYGSGRGMVATARDILQGLTPGQTPLVEMAPELTTRQIVQAAQKNDIVAQRALNVWHEHVAIGIVNLAHILDPDVFVLTGGLAECVDFELLHEMVVDRCMVRIGENMNIQKSELDGLAGIVGAAQLIMDAISERAK